MAVSDERFIFEGAGVRKGKVEGQCEDAFFVSKRGLGVSDGVGSWNKYGISAA